MKINNLDNKINNSYTFSGKLHVKTCHSLLNKIGDMTPQNYDKMHFAYKYFIRKSTPKRLNELAKTSCDIAFKLKEKFDRFYGKDNYCIIAVGRSLASVAEAAKFMGVDAKVIPMSQLKTNLPKQIPDVNVYKEFLEKIGLNKKLIKDNPKKKFVLMDYAVSGDSLSSAKKFLEFDELLGKSDNFIDREINLFIFSPNVLNLMFYERFKNFAPVGKLPLGNLKDVFKQADSTTSREGRFNICQYMRKLFLFNVLDSLKLENFHNFIPFKEIEKIGMLETNFMKRYDIMKTFLS